MYVSATAANEVEKTKWKARLYARNFSRMIVQAKV
jgi:hypothetical protein